jgi:hypothetical protein
MSLHDLMKPERSRVQRILSALINLHKYRQEPLDWYAGLVAKKVRTGKGRGEEGVGPVRAGGRELLTTLYISYAHSPHPRPVFTYAGGAHGEETHCDCEAERAEAAHCGGEVSSCQTSIPPRLLLVCWLERTWGTKVVIRKIQTNLHITCVLSPL